VNDEVTTCSKVTRLVRSLGFQARSCPSGAAALRFLRALPGAARLVLADLAMPRMDGGEFAERVKDPTRDFRLR
jgi:CheY-like chemotaxis protein